MKFLTRLLTAALPGILLTHSALAQTPAPAAPAPTGSLTGVVLDSLTRQPVAYATVVLLPAAPAADAKPVTGVAADDQGHFTMTKLAAGSFRLRASYVGYASRARAVTVTTGATEAGRLLLPASATALAEAVVVGQKPVVEVKPDRLVYNADQDAGNAGGTAQDVLRKTPLLAVDGEGNVKMRGSANFKVLINNKPSPRLASNLAEALKSIPAEQIQSVEVITTPPAKYDGEGTAGIINIVLKKGTNQGLNGNVSVSSGNRNSTLNTSFNFRQDKVNFTSSAGSGAWYNPNQILGERRTFNEQGQLRSTQTQGGNGLSRGGWGYANVGVDYDPKEHHALSLALGADGYGGEGLQGLRNRVTAFDNSANQLFYRDTRNVFNAVNFNATGTYTRTFAGVARKEWTVLSQYTHNNSLFGYDFAQYNGLDGPLVVALASSRERSRGRTPGSEITLQTDLTQPFGDKRTLEMGLKGIFRRTSSVASVDGTSAVGGELGTLTGRGTDFAYAQNVQSAYATYSFPVGKKVSASLGSRLERTGIAADFRATNTPFPDRTYLTWLPNSSAQYKISEASSLRLAYSRRITRPFIDFLNPFVDRSNPLNISFGNPNLDPELTHSAELSYNTAIKTSTLNAGLSVRHTGNAIEGIRFASTNPAAPLPAGVLPDPAVTLQTFGNVAANTFYQLNIYGSVKFNPSWSLSGGPDVQYVVRRSSALGTSREGFTANLNLNTSYKLKKGWTVQGYAYSGLRTVEIQGFGPANLYYQLGAKKVFWKEKADLTLNFASPFNRFWPYTSTTTTPVFDETFTYRAFQQGFRLNFSYRFGQGGPGKQRKSVSNDDQKSGGSKQGGQ